MVKNLNFVGSNGSIKSVSMKAGERKREQEMRGREEEKRGRKEKRGEGTGASAKTWQALVGFGEADRPHMSATATPTGPPNADKPARLSMHRDRRVPARNRSPRGRVGPVGFAITDWIVFLKKKNCVIFP